ncbi:hypothetical protein AMS68_002181 [Peltaster fructicola]|uniref:Uncharacterized protein n=1 Tax=Peltaster fructicola TaxID=286661 RepID=A0A6H0XPK9_9PEZI|nr:hypothetical protein AMS68_002181 [Peltaster fructicola]
MMLKYFRMSLHPPDCYDRLKVTLSEATPRGLDICLRVLHADADLEPEHSCTSKDVWSVMIVAHKLKVDLSVERASIWFRRWFFQHAPEKLDFSLPGDADKLKKHTSHRFSSDEYCDLLQPSYHFDCIEAFKVVTGVLVYDYHGTIRARGPVDTKSEAVKLHESILERLNVARSELLNDLQASLHQPIQKFVAGNSWDRRLSQQDLQAYMKALVQTGKWPFQVGHIKHDSSLNTTLDHLLLASFSENTQSLKVNVDRAVKRCRRQFVGLCLDCLTYAPLNPVRERWVVYEEHMHRHDKCRDSHEEDSSFLAFSKRVTRYFNDSTRVVLRMPFGIRIFS